MPSAQGLGCGPGGRWCIEPHTRLDTGCTPRQWWRKRDTLSPLVFFFHHKILQNHFGSGEKIVHYRPFFTKISSIGEREEERGGLKEANHILYESISNIPPQG